MQIGQRTSHRDVVAALFISSGLHVPARAGAGMPGSVQCDADAFIHEFSQR
jgi:hypothetical protein